MPAPPGRLIAEPALPESVITQFVVKVHSRCDLACDHCYVYEHADQSWRDRPTAIARQTVVRAAERIAEHAKRHGLSSVRVILHGGEPLLLGRDRLDEALHLLRDALAPIADVDLRLHTNGVRLSAEFCEVFDRHGVKVGVSLDGGRAANDLHRRFANGRSSHDDVLKGLSLLRRPEYRHLYAGILCTIDVRNDPISVYEALLREEPPVLDFLLPHATWANPPARYRDKQTEYGDWLVAIYERWLADGRPVPIRTFTSLERTALGGPSLTEALGAEVVDLVVIETDGTYEQVDSLKIAYHGAPATGFNVFEHDVDTATGHPGFAARLSGIEGLSDTCRDCPVVRRCRGGFYPHRYSQENGFDNPSVYCEDLRTLVEKIPGRDGGVPAPAPPPALPDGVPESLVRDLIDGVDAPEGLQSLAALQNWINRVVLVQAAREAAHREPAAARAWDALVRIEERSPEAVSRAFDQQPHLRVWAASLRSADTATVDRDWRPLEAVAISAAVYGGLAERLTMRPRDGELYFPGAGTLSVPAATSAAVTTHADGFVVETDDGRVYEIDLTAPDRAGRSWRPLPHLEAQGISIALDDSDPYRDCYGWPAADRLGPTDVAAWRSDFAEAVAFLDEHLGHHAASLRAVLRTLVPLSADPTGRARSASAWNVFGSAGIARPDTPDTLALLLVHELQHIKLNALLDFTELYDRADRTLYYAPWRREHRPLRQFLHGTLAHIAVTEYWRVQSRIRPVGASRTAALDEFTTTRADTENAIATLLGSGKLTEEGRMYVERASDPLRRIPRP